MSLVRNFVTVLSGRLFAQILTVIAMPILARLYTPEDFGAVSLLTALIQVPAALYMWRFEQAIPQAKSDQEAGVLFTLSLGIATVHTCILYLVLCFLPHS